jgi:uncharacterized cupin superfamily protein
VIIRKNNAETETRTSEDWGTVHTQRIGDVGGITQFGASLQTLEPGARSSLKHWHENTDEMLLVISGELTATENGVDHVLTAGDAACWPKGVAVAHTVSNRSDAPCSFIVVGTRSKDDVTHYEEIGEIMRTDAEGWTITDLEGHVLRSGKHGESPWT